MTLAIAGAAAILSVVMIPVSILTMVHYRRAGLLSFLRSAGIDPTPFQYQVITAAQPVAHDPLPLEAPITSTIPIIAIKTPISASQRGPKSPRTNRTSESLSDLMSRLNHSKRMRVTIRLARKPGSR